jgi:hypothetical protein
MDISKTRFTIDKWGCLVFPADADVIALGLDNCFVVKGDKSLWVFPFNILSKYIQEFTYDNTYRRWGGSDFDDFIKKNKENYFILYGKIIKQTYHYCCKNKMNFITTGNSCYTCHFTALQNTLFKWNKSKCKYIKPLYCDISHTTCRVLLFTNLCPDIQTEQMNKQTLTERGKRATITKKLSETKCNMCIYNASCKHKSKRVEQNCSISRKMLNRRMRQMADQRFGKYSKLVEIMRYIGLTKGRGKTAWKTIVPINKVLIATQQKEDYTFRYKPLSEIKQEFTKVKAANSDTEYKAKVFMFFLCNLTDANEIYKAKADGDSIWRLGYNTLKRGSICIQNYEFKSYSDIIKTFGRFGQEQVEKLIRR